MKSIDKFVLVLVASLALLLAGCGGGSSSTEPEETGPTPEEMAMERAKTQTANLMTASTGVDTALDGLSGSEPTQAQIDAVNTAIGGLEAALMAAADVDDAVKAGYQGKVDSAKITAMNADEALMAMEKEANAMEAKEMAALGKKLHMVLSTTSMMMPMLTPDGVKVGTDEAAVTLKAGDSAESLSGWAGMNYARTEGKGDDMMVTDEARVYTNQGPAKSVTYAKSSLPQPATSGTGLENGNGGAAKGYVMLGTNLNSNDHSVTLDRIMADAFEHSGEQSHKIPDNNVALKVRGTYGGAPGEFRCTGTCASTNDGKGSPSALDGNWYFKPDADAMVSQPDPSYLYYGWWVQKDKDGPTEAKAFTGAMVLTPPDGTMATTGSATYKGGAAGKFAMSNALDGTGSGGHFTADAELKATFGGEDMGVTGTIDNFMLNDGTEDAGWSVTLHRATWDDTTNGMFATVDDDETNDVDESMMGTTWSINGNSAGRTGNWSGQMYDEMTGDDDDGSNVPTTVTGMFQSSFSAMGRMVGAFGADLDD